MKIQFGTLNVPVVKTNFGDQLDLKGLIPPDCDTVMVAFNTGSGIQSGNPIPIGFLRLTHQIYVQDLQQLLAQYSALADSVSHSFNLPRPVRSIMILPFRAKEMVQAWTAP